MSIKSAVAQQLIAHTRSLQFRGKSRVVGRITPRSGRQTARVFDAQMDLDLGNYVDRTIFMGCYEPLNTFLFARTLRPGMTVVDAGANIGYFSLLSASLVGPAGKVIAVEAHPRNFETLIRAVRRNKLKQVLPVNIGLSDENGIGQISMADQHIYPNRTASMVPDPGTPSIPVPVRKLDDCLREWELRAIDLLKIDVDGFETKIIKGAGKCLAAGVVKNVIIEFNTDWLKASGSSPAELLALFEAAGFVDRSSSHRIASALLGPTEDRHFVHRTAL